MCRTCCDLERRRESHKNFIQGAARAGNGGNDRNRNTGGYDESVRETAKTFLKQHAAN
jgi:hypothetical protein